MRAKTQVWLMRAAGGEAWQLTDAKEGVGGDEWAPDSRKIAYMARDPLSKEQDEARRRKDDERIFEGDHRMQHIWSIDVDSKQATQLTTGTDYTVRGMTWAPDSTRLAFGAGPTPMIRDERQDIYLVTLATKHIEAIVETAAPESGPRWSPDGRTIAYTMLPTGDATTNRDGIMTRPLFNSHYPDGKTMKLYRERSALTYVDQVTTPLLIMHGQNDERVPIGQPMEFYRALKDRGKTVELVWYPREGHSNSEYYHQRDQIRRELEWMTKHVLADRATTTSSR